VPVCGRRVGNMAVRMGLDGDVVFVGGVSKNVGVRRELQEFLGIEFFELPGDPQLNGALGAACWPRRRIMATSSGAASRRQVSPAAGTRRSARASIRAVDDA